MCCRDVYGVALFVHKCMKIADAAAVAAARQQPRFVVTITGKSSDRGVHKGMNMSISDHCDHQGSEQKGATSS
jgi:hypothetical protein